MKSFQKKKIERVNCARNVHDYNLWITLRSSDEHVLDALCFNLCYLS